MAKQRRMDVAVRLSDELREALDDEIERLEKRDPWVGWTASAVMRLALQLYLKEPDRRPR
jgi:hypothetical protein